MILGGGKKTKQLFSIVNTLPAHLVFQMGRGTDKKNESGIYGRNLARGKFWIVCIERCRFSLAGTFYYASNHLNCLLIKNLSPS